MKLRKNKKKNRNNEEAKKLFEKIDSVFPTTKKIKERIRNETNGKRSIILNFSVIISKNQSAHEQRPESEVPPNLQRPLQDKRELPP
jgi:hypothetical protein